MRYLIDFLRMRRRTVTAVTWIAVGVLLPLTILTLLVIVLRLGNFAIPGIDTIFIVPDEPSFSVGDGDGAWTTDTKIDLFSISQENGSGELTILSGDGDNIIAPGSTGMYRFELKNPGNVALHCDYLLGASFNFSGENGFIRLPFSVRLRDMNGTYIIGSETEWVPYHQLSATEQTLTLGKNSYASYELEWRWDFEGNSDLIDTYYGTNAVKQDLVLTLSIATSAELAMKPDDLGVGDVLNPDEEPLTGGEFNPLPFVILGSAIVLCLTIIILIYISYRHKRGHFGVLYRISGGRRHR